MLGKILCFVGGFCIGFAVMYMKEHVTVVNLDKAAAEKRAAVETSQATSQVDPSIHQEIRTGSGFASSADTQDNVTAMNADAK